MANSLMRIEAVKQAIRTLPVTPRVLANLAGDASRLCLLARLEADFATGS